MIPLKMVKESPRYHLHELQPHGFASLRVLTELARAAAVRFHFNGEKIAKDFSFFIGHRAFSMKTSLQYKTGCGILFDVFSGSSMAIRWESGEIVFGKHVWKQGHYQLK